MTQQPFSLPAGEECAMKDYGGNKIDAHKVDIKSTKSYKEICGVGAKRI